jgi:uncharacterized phage-associated protein
MGYPFEFSEKKTTEAAGLLLNLKGGRADYLWLIKMLYYIDREAINRWERPVTYDHYNSMDYGPVLMSVYELILGKRIGTIWRNYIHSFNKGSTYEYEVWLLGSAPRLRKLSVGEEELIHEMFKQYGDYTGFELAEMSHKFPEWKDPKGSTIPIEFSDILKSLDFSEEDLHRIADELKAEQALDTLFGG